MEGAIDCMELINGKGLKSALVTSSIKKLALAILDNISFHSGLLQNIGESFSVTVFGDEIKNLKPEPDIYIHAIERLGVKPEYCCALEDSEVGVASAKRAGLFVIAVPNSHTKNQCFDHADLIVSSLKEVIQLDIFN